MTLKKKLIHDHLLSLCKAGPFYACTVNHKTGVMTIDESKSITPAGVSISELNSVFHFSKQRRTLAMDRGEWRWEARLDFPSRTIAFEAFEDLLTDAVIEIPQPAGAGRSLLAALDRVDYNPPPQSSPSGGSAAIFTFLILPESLRK